MSAAVSAYQEAVSHLMQGLALLGTLDTELSPDLALDVEGIPHIAGMPSTKGTSLRDAYEMAFQAALGDALSVTEGWTTEAKQAYARAYELARALGQPPETAQILYNLATVHEFRGEYKEAETLVQEHLKLPTVERDLRKSMASYELLSCSTFHQGVFDLSLEHADRGLAFYTAYQQEAMPVGGGDLSSACQGWGALDLWFMGYPDRAVTRVQAAVKLAEEADHPYSLSRALIQAGSLYHMRREIDLVMAHAERAIDVATTHHFAYYAAAGSILHGWARVAQGSGEGLAELLSGLDAHRRTSAEMDRPYDLGLLAEAYSMQQRAEDALAALNEALGVVNQGRAFFHELSFCDSRG